MRVALRMRGQTAEEMGRIIDSVVAQATAAPEPTLVDQVVEKFRADVEKYTMPRPVDPSPDAVKLQRLSPYPSNPSTWDSVAEPLAFNEETYMKELKATYDLRKDHQALMAHATKEHRHDRDMALQFPDAAAVATADFANKLFALEEPLDEELTGLLGVSRKERDSAVKLRPAPSKPKEERADNDKDEEDSDEPTPDEIELEKELAAGGDVEVTPEEVEAGLQQIKDDGDSKNAGMRKREQQRQHVLRHKLPLEGSLGPFAENSSSRVDFAIRQALAGLASEAAQLDATTTGESVEDAAAALHKQQILHLRTMTDFDSMKKQLGDLRNELQDKLHPSTQAEVWEMERQEMSDKEFEETMETLQIDASEDMSDAQHRELIIKYLNLARDLRQGQDTGRLQALQAALEKSLSSPRVPDHAAEIMRSWATNVVDANAMEEEAKRAAAQVNSEEAIAAESAAESLKGKSHRKKMRPEGGVSHGQRETLKSAGARVQQHLPHHLPYGDDEDNWPFMKVIEVRPHVNVTKAGRVSTFSASVLIGNGEGSAGFGYARGKDAKEATDRALRDAYRNIITIERFEDRTIPYPVEAKYCRTKVIMRGLHNFGGLRCHDEMKDLMDAFGFEDMFIKVYHRRVLSHLYKAVFNALEKIKAPETIAKERGKIFFNPSKVLTNRPQWGL